MDHPRHHLKTHCSCPVLPCKEISPTYLKAQIQLNDSRCTTINKISRNPVPRTPKEFRELPNEMFRLRGATFQPTILGTWESLF